MKEIYFNTAVPTELLIHENITVLIPNQLDL